MALGGGGRVGECNRLIGVCIYSLCERVEWVRCWLWGEAHARGAIVNRRATICVAYVSVCQSTLYPWINEVGPSVVRNDKANVSCNKSIECKIFVIYRAGLRPTSPPICSCKKELTCRWGVTEQQRHRGVLSYHIILTSRLFLGSSLVSSSIMPT